MKVETVGINGLRYVVATLREEDLDRIAQKVARLIRDEDQARVDRELAAEHARQVPLAAIEEAARIPTDALTEVPWRRPR